MQNIGRPLHVGLVEILAPAPKSKHPGCVHDAFAPRHRPKHSVAVPDIANHQSHAQVPQKAGIRRGAYQGPHGKTDFDQMRAEIPPQETCRSSDEYHNLTSLAHPLANS